MRRRFFLFAAPAIVAAPSLMKISALALPQKGKSWYSGYETLAMSESDLVTATLRARMPYLIHNITQTNAVLRAIRDGNIAQGEIRVNTRLIGEIA